MQLQQQQQMSNIEKCHNWEKKRRRKAAESESESESALLCHQISSGEKGDNWKRKRKRRRRRRKAKAESPILSLSYDLVFEILIRVVDVRSVIRCRVVCKYWLSLINSAHYYHKRIDSESESSLPCSFIFRYRKPLQTRNPLYEYLPEKSQILHYGIKSNDHHQQQSYLSFLPWHNVRIFSTFKDLLLFSAGKYSTERLMICNPFTRQWIELPKLSFELSWAECGGFVCEPYKQQQQQQQQLKLDQYRYRVMLLLPNERHYGADHRGRVDFTAITFSSDSRKWSFSKFSFPADLDCNPPVACNGMLYWLEETMDMTYTVHKIVAFDPFKDEHYHHHIDLPLDLHKGIGLSTVLTLRIGLVKGRLRLSQLLPNEERRIGFVLKVWELDYNDDGFPWTWTLVHHVEVKIKFKLRLFVIAFHPDNGNFIYLLRGYRHIYQYDITEEKIKQVGKLPNNGEKSFPTYLHVFTLMHPLWPTLLPSV